MSTPKFCWSCGALVDPGDTVCSYCGVKLRDVTPKADTKLGATSQLDARLKTTTGNRSDLAPVTAPRVGWQPRYQRSEGIQVLNKWGWVASLFIGTIVLVSGAFLH
ncbi:MAG TPA: zinc ribbon domain-containing protein [Candidatus Lokiarchaeia archaeon]|nr:zinc ribbon domain-containing protein [Candidatus Lokiarchaeia archaeon]